MSTRHKLGEETGISCETPARIRGLAVFVECLAVGLACRDQRRLTGSGSTLEVLCDDVLYKYTFTLLYFIVNCNKRYSRPGFILGL